MTETKRDYEIGYGKPPVGRRFKKGQSGNPRGGKVKKTAPPLLVRKFDEQVIVATRGRREKTTRREVVVVQLFDELGAPGLSVSKLVSEMLKEVERKAGLAGRSI
jgi:hypothetical protein